MVRRRFPAPDAPEHRLLTERPAAPPLDRAASLEAIARFRAERGWGSRSDADAGRPVSDPSPDEIAERKAALVVQAAQLGVTGQCDRCRAVVSTVALRLHGAERWCPPCQGAYDEDRINSPSLKETR